MTDKWDKIAKGIMGLIIDHSCAIFEDARFHDGQMVCHEIETKIVTELKQAYEDGKQEAR